MKTIINIASIILFLFSALAAQEETPAGPITESWYTYWGAGLSKISYPSELQDVMDELKRLDGISSSSIYVDMLGFYWHINPKTIGSVLINGCADRVEDSDDNWLQLNYYLSSGSVIQYLDQFGSGPFIRADLGIANAVYQDSEDEVVESENGFGVLAGGGWSWDLGGTRILWNINYAYRVIEDESYGAFGLSLGGLF